MTREEAKNLLLVTPEYIPGACTQCGALSHEEAAKKCRQTQLPSGDYVCATPEEGPNSENDTGPLYQRNPDYDELNGYLWGWYAVDDGFTNTPPEWRSRGDARSAPTSTPKQAGR